MSNQAITWVLDHSESSGNDRCVMFALANRANWVDGDGVEVAWPTMKLVAAEANVSKRTAQRCLRRLEDELGEVEAVELSTGDKLPNGQTVSDGRYAPNLYRLVGMRRQGRQTDTSEQSGVSGADLRGDSADTQNPKGTQRTTSRPADAADPQPDDDEQSQEDPNRFPRPTPSPDRSFTRKAVEWANTRDMGGHLDASTPPAEVTWWVLELAKMHYGQGTPPYERCARQAIIEYAERVCDEAMTKPARGQLRRLISTFGAPMTMNAVMESIEAGAGLDPEYADDDRAVMNYAKSVLKRWRTEGSGRTVLEAAIR